MELWGGGPAREGRLRGVGVAQVSLGFSPQLSWSPFEAVDLKGYRSLNCYLKALLQVATRYIKPQTDAGLHQESLSPLFMYMLDVFLLIYTFLLKVLAMKFLIHIYIYHVFFIKMAR